MCLIVEKTDATVTRLGNFVKVNEFRCSHCKKHFTSSKSLFKHKKTCKSYFCVTCKKTFFIEANFQKHFKSCPPKRFSCRLCNKSYSRKSDRDKHEKSHPAVKKTFRCNNCGATCLTEGMLALHAKEHF